LPKAQPFFLFPCEFTAGRFQNFFIMSAPQQLGEILRRVSVSDQDRQHRLFAITEQILTSSPQLQSADFTKLNPDDLQLIYELYDDQFFGGLIQRSFDQQRMSFRVSSRMTRAGGKTTRWGDPRRPEQLKYEIAISSTLLFQSFQDPERPVTVTGIECVNRLEGLLRVMEHELIHLAEMLVWSDSNCALHRFQGIAQRQFGHLQHTHNLLTPRELALREYNIRAGSHVAFVLDGRRYEGIVNRITRRATVLVPDASGEPFSDGRRYLRFYVPIAQLESLD